VSTFTPDKLFYFNSADEIARAVQERSLSWISPARLDGITEVNHKSSVNFSAEDLIRPFVKTACSLIFSNEEPQGESALINAIKRWREAERFTETEEAEGVLKGLCSKIIEQHIASQDAINAAWYNACAAKRFVQLFPKVDKFPVWQEFGANFQGATLEFNTAEGSPVDSAKAVRYVNESPNLTTVKEQVHYLLHSKRVHPERHLESKLLNKAPALKSQAEWRCFKEIENADSSSAPESWNSDVPFDLEFLSAVYLGPAIPASAKESILGSVTKMENPPKVVQLSFANGKFDLASEVIHTKTETQEASGA